MIPVHPKYSGQASWNPISPAPTFPQDFTQIQTIDLHTEGEPLRVIICGFPELKGSTILEYRADCKSRFDHLRTALMFEPRGHADMYGCILTPSTSEGADFGIFFLHNEGYSTMCGHAIIAITTLVIEMGWVAVITPETRIEIDTPAGRVTAYGKVRENRVESVYFHNVPSFVAALDQTVEVPGLGTVGYDLAFGGAFYAYVPAEPLGLALGPDTYRQLIESGMAIKHAVMEQSDKIVHPFETDLSFLYGTIFIGPSPTPGMDSRNVCIFAEGEVDRSPTGTGVSGRMAIHHARKEIAMGQSMKIESIIGSHFRASVKSETTFGSFPAIIPEVEGRAFITGSHKFLIDPKDPLKNGFILR